MKLLYLPNQWTATFAPLIGFPFRDSFGRRRFSVKKEVVVRKNTKKGTEFGISVLFGWQKIISRACFSIARLQKCRRFFRPSSFCSHKQRCSTVPPELCYEVVYNLNTFFLNLKKRTAVKAVKDTKLRYKNTKMSRNKSFDYGARFKAIYSASKTKKYLLKNRAIGNRLLF